MAVTYDEAPIIHRYFNTDFGVQREFEITLVAENYAGCSDQISRTVTVEPAIVADFEPSVL